MHLATKRFALFGMAIILFVLPQAAVAGTDVVAKVGSVQITSYELQREIQRRIPQVASHGGVSQEKIDQIRQAALEALVERAYKVQYALDQQLAVTPEEVDAVVQPLFDKYASPEELAKAMGGETPDAFRLSIQRQLLAEKAEQLAVDSKATVSDQELQDDYAANAKRYFRPLQFKASHILIKVDPASTAEEFAKRKARAEALLARARAGEDFYNLAYYESDDRSKYVGGSLGYFHEGQTVAEFDQAVKTLKQGEISDLVQTRWGFHIIKLDERKEARQLEFDEVKEKIRNDLEKERRTALYKEWLGELKKRYPVEKFE